MTSVLHFTIDNATDCSLVAKLRRSLRGPSSVNLILLKVGACTLEQPLLFMTPGKVTVTSPIISRCKSCFVRVDGCKYTILLHCRKSLVAFELVHLHTMIRTDQWLRCPVIRRLLLHRLMIVIERMQVVDKIVLKLLTGGWLRRCA